MEIKKPFNNQQLTDAVAAHELEIKKLKFKETEQDLRLDKLEKKKKTPTKCGGVKQPRVTIADVMERLMQFQDVFTKFQTSVDERFNKLETQVNKLETSVDERFNKLETSVNKRFNKLETSVNKLETQVQALNKAVFRK